jgi:hypothetical protein
MRVGSHNSDRRDSERADVGAVQIGRRRRNASTGVVRITLAARSRLLCCRPAPPRRDVPAGVEDRRGTGLPEPAPRCLRAPGRPHERGRVPALLTAVEVGSSRPTPDELEIHVRSVSGRVSKKSPVTVGPVELRIGLKNDPLSDRREAEQRSPSRPRVALTRAELGRIDLQETDPSTIADSQRVTVINGRDYHNLRQLFFPIRRSSSDGKCRKSNNDRAKRGKSPSQPQPMRTQLQSQQPQKRSFPLRC